MKFSDFRKKMVEDGEGAAPANVTGAGVSTDIPVVHDDDRKKYLFRRPKAVTTLVKKEGVVQWNGTDKPTEGPANN